jgi:PhnB protein
MSSVKLVPDGYHTVTPYLLVQDAEKLIDFVIKVFDAKETVRMSMPNGTIGHAEVRLGDSVIMLSEAQGGEYKPMPTGIYLYVENCDAIYKLALEAGATSIMQPTDQFYGDRSAGIKDHFGNHWYIATHIEDLSKEELTKRMDEYMKKRAQGQEE